MEQWKIIHGFDGMYMVSNHGNIKGIARTKVTATSGKLTEVKEKLLKPYKGGKGVGYLRVCLSKDNKKTIAVIHRLVAELFIPAIDGKTNVNHINGNRYDNHYKNLEWCTNSENMHHYYKLKRQSIIEHNNALQLEVNKP